jgi:hypothetical protein
MRWRIVIEAPIVNEEGGISDKRYWVWGTHFEPNNAPFIPRIGEQLYYTTDRSKDVHLKVVDVVTKYIGYDDCNVHLICDLVKDK